VKQICGSETNAAFPSAVNESGDFRCCEGFRTLRVVSLESVMRSRADTGQCRHHGGDRDLGAAVGAQMHEVCDRLPVPVAHAALARYGFIEG
jgi:hypothetical protein